MGSSAAAPPEAMLLAKLRTSSSATTENRGQSERAEVRVRPAFPKTKSCPKHAPRTYGHGYTVLGRECAAHAALPPRRLASCLRHVCLHESGTPGGDARDHTHTTSPASAHAMALPNEGRAQRTRCRCLQRAWVAPTTPARPTSPSSLHAGTRRHVGPSPRRCRPASSERTAGASRTAGVRGSS